VTLQANSETGSFEDELARWSLVATVGIVVFSIGYEAGSVLAGDSLDVFWLVPILGGMTTVILALHAREDD
jgi:lipid-A-disaccharide synthase-like uncharacterized protein